MTSMNQAIQQPDHLEESSNFQFNLFFIITYSVIILLSMHSNLLIHFTKSCVHRTKPIFCRRFQQTDSFLISAIFSKCALLCALRRQWKPCKLKKSVSNRLNDQAKSNIRYHFLLYANSKGFNSLSIMNMLMNKSYIIHK